MIDLADYRAWRERVAPWHPLPDGYDSCCYLFTEAGEAMDSALRMRRPGDDRTNGHRRNLGRELAQVVDMACAVTLDWQMTDFSVVGMDVKRHVDANAGFYVLRSVCAYAGQLLDAAEYGPGRLFDKTLLNVIESAYITAALYGFDLDAELQAWMAEVEGRRP